jgi:hypothetical protein
MFENLWRCCLKNLRKTKLFAISPAVFAPGTKKTYATEKSNGIEQILPWHSQDQDQD